MLSIATYCAHTVYTGIRTESSKHADDGTAHIIVGCIYIYINMYTIADNVAKTFPSSTL